MPYLRKFSFSRFRPKSSRPIRSLDFSNCYIFWTIQSFFINFCMKIEHHKSFKMMLSLFWKNAFLPPKRAKRSKSRYSSWTKSTFLYIAQNWLIGFFLIFCMKLEIIRGYKLTPTPFLVKFSFGHFQSFLGENPQIVYCSIRVH